MSYDLFFYKKRADSLSTTDIKEYLTRLPNAIIESETQWFYENQETGVYCSFLYSGSEVEEEIEEESFADFENTGFSFNINFIRSHFFGKECFPIVERFVNDLNLYIVNPQKDSVPQKIQSGVLEEEWGAINVNLVKSHFKENGLDYLELNKSNYTWHFCTKKKALQERLGEEYFVPGIFYMKKRGSNTVETLSIWPDHIPYVLPKVDYILVRKTVIKFFKERKEEGLVKYSDLISLLGEYFVDEEDYKIIHPDKSNNISDIFNNLPVVEDFSKNREVVTVDTIVNIKEQ